MRPRSLTLRGFRSYADETRFDFTGRRLVGIAGPIGAGKSSILDAVAFALYGETPRGGKTTNSLISQRRDTLHVELVFEVDGEVWKVVRVLRRKGAPAHTLYRVDDAGEHAVATKAADVTARVEALLGLEFDAFRRSVLLAQNQFAGFIEATPGKRDQVLKGVFGFDRLDAMREVAKSRLDAIKVSLQHLTVRRAHADSERKQRDALTEVVAAADLRFKTLEALRESVVQADDTLRTAEAVAKAATAEIAEVDEIVARVPTHDATTKLFGAASAADAKRLETGAALAAAATAAAAAAAGFEATLAAIGGRQALDRAVELAARLDAARDAVVAVDRRRLKLAAEESAAGEAIAAASAAAASAEAAAVRVEQDAAAAGLVEEAARTRLHAAHEADRAFGLRTGLVVGDPCPVCRQAVAVLPPHGEPGDLAAAETALGAAVSAVAAARQAVAAAMKDSVQGATRVQTAIGRQTELAAAAVGLAEEAATAGVAVTELESALAVTLGAGDPRRLLEEIRSRLSAAEEAERAARSAETAARGTSEAAGAEAVRAMGALERLRGDIANLVGRLGLELTIADGVAGIDGALRVVRDECVRRSTAAAANRDRAGHEAEAARAARTELLEGAGLAASDDIVEITHAAAREASDRRADLGAVERNLATLDALDADEAATLSSRELLERLHGDLLDSGFVKWVLDEQRRVLADLAGVHLETLTAGRYRFSDDGEFDIIDLIAADLVRPATSLSGGETFLASLALALALAEIVSREGGRLDAFFLDEGFGSLDPEHLDLAMDGVERLVASGGDRLVVVVSHVPALRERFEDLIILDRDAVTGVTRVVSGAGGEP
jgi:exonuclease SbcC